MNAHVLRLGAFLFPLVGLACGAESMAPPLAEPEPEAEPSEPVANVSDADMDRLRALDHDLSLGSTGDDVVAVHAYLSRYGYFPNSGLQRHFPTWRPLVAEPPASTSTYDQRTVEAVQKFQGYGGLPASGIVDEATRDLLRAHRCEYPDGMGHGDPADKFAIINKYWGSSIKFWYDNSFTSSQPNPNNGYKTRVQAAMNTWSADTNISFSVVTTGSYNISLKWDALPCYPFACNQDSWATTSRPGSTADITMNKRWRWWYGAGAPPNDGLSIDFESVFLHELGHAIGLDHSSIAGAVMQGTINAGTVKRALTVDDKVAISSMYDQWEQLDGDTKDIGVGPTGDTWAVSASDHSVWKFDSNGWHSVGGDAERIAVGYNGWPFVIAGWGDGSIWFRNSNSPSNSPPPGWIDPPAWIQLEGGGCAKDIGVGVEQGPLGPTNAIWVIGCGSGADTGIFKWTSSGWVQDHAWGAAQHITVDHDGTPWVQNSAGNIFKYTTNDPYTGSWRSMTSPAARDIAVGPSDYPYIASTSATSGVPYLLDSQFFADDGSGPPPPFRYEWRYVGVGNIANVVSIAAGPKGEPWLVDSSNRLFHTKK
jgi:peptidoglycan hydrolase-like protein with peptidoglycan-binding domain